MVVALRSPARGTDVRGYGKIQIVVGISLILVGIALWAPFDPKFGFIALVGIAIFGYDPDSDSFGS